jgi:predicted unusual protein kinase regulating ubiquinone biosynthesis (AarF/ABC1/UbiB family)
MSNGEKEPEKAKAEKNGRDKKGGPSTGRLSRFAKISSMTAGVATRTVTQKMVGAFQDLDARQAAEKKALHKSAEQMAKTLGELKGAAMKVGQMLTTDPELLPPEIIEHLSVLQNSAPAMDFDMVREVVENALGGKLEDHYVTFSEEAIGAASIGQVHRATTHEGQDVAVKVQYPGIAATIEADLKNLGAVMNVAKALIPAERVDAYIEEVKEVIANESDYHREADNLERFIVLLRDLPGIRVPTPVQELTRKDVLTMEFIEGPRLVDHLQEADQNERNEKMLTLMTAYLHMMHRHGALHVDPHPGNFLVDQEGRVVLLDLGAVRDYSLDFGDNLIRMIIAMWEHDTDLLKDGWERLAFVDKGIDPEMIYDWFNLILDPLLEDREFDFGDWSLQEEAMRFVLKNPKLKLFAPPQEVIFYMRVMAGMRGLLAQSRAQSNVYQLAMSMAEERGLL